MVKIIAASALFCVAQASTFKVDWSDCGDASTHAKVTSLSPTTIQTGKTTTLHGKGALDKDVKGATFSAVIKANGVQVASCSGDASKDIVCNLPLKAGHIAVKAMSFPLKAGDIPVDAEVKLSSLIPASLAKATSHVAAVSDTGDKLVCLDIKTSKQEPTVQASTFKVDWSDCGDAATHAKVTSLSPTTIQTGKTTTLHGKGALDKDVTGATFSAVIKASGVKVASCSGDASKDIVCNLPLSAGHIAVKAMSFPLKAGDIPVDAEVKLSSLIPASLATATSHVAAVSDTGDKLVCLDIKTSKQEPNTDLYAGALAGGKLAVTWKDCGDAATHGHITDLQPTEITIGQDGTLTGTGTIDETLTDGSFTIKVTADLGIKETYTGKACEAKTFNLPLNLGTVSWGGLDCPVSPGKLTQKVAFTTKSFIPAALAKADVSASAVDQNGDKAACITAHLERKSFDLLV